jgi:ParB family transcriptional regulator, chromosome partitioning protein
VSKKALGRGLDALISTDDTTGQDRTGITELSTDQVDSANSQPRKHFPENTLQELAASIRENGVIQPIIVEKNGDRYSVIAGERRLRAARIAGLEKIPAIIRDYPPENLLQIALIENIQREDLNPIEEASAYETLLDQTKISQEELAERLGKSRTAITNSLRLLKLPETMRQALSDGALSPGHARAILSVVQLANRKGLFESIIENGLSVREAERLAGEYNAAAPVRKEETQKQKRQKDPEVRALEQRLLEAFGTKVELKGSLTSGKIEVSYYSQDDLERILELLSIDSE